MNWRIGSSLDCFALLAMTLRYIRVIANEVKQSKSRIVFLLDTFYWSLSLSGSQKLVRLLHAPSSKKPIIPGFFETRIGT